MTPYDPAYLYIAAVCFAGAAAIFLVFFWHSLSWRIRDTSWRERGLVGSVVVALATAFIYVSAGLLTPQSHFLAYASSSPGQAVRP